jgi:hypothetical protein
MNRIEESRDLAVNTLVQSRYRAPWYGYVVSCKYEKYTCGGTRYEHYLAEVMQTHTRYGQRMKKGRKHSLDTAWLRVIDKIPEMP